MARIISVLSGKGGVGKTTSTVNLGYCIHKLGAEVILVDGNLTSPNLCTHLGNSFFPKTLHDVMQNLSEIHEAVYEHETGLKIVPANLSVDSIKLIDYDALHAQLQELHLLSDFVLIDGSPGIGVETENLIRISDEVLILTNPSKPALVDAKRLLDYLKKQKKPVAGLILNKHHSNVDIDEVEAFLNHTVFHTIYEDHRRFVKSISEKTPFVHKYPNHKSTMDYETLAKKITGKVLEKNK